MNKVMLIGNLCKDPELKTTPTGRSVCSCSMATNETYKDQQGVKQTVAQFHNLVIWQKPAETFAQYLKKGSKVAIIGKLQTRSWDDKNGGGKKYMTEIVVGEFEFLTPKSQSGDSGNSQPAQEQNQSQPAPAQAQDDVEEIKVDDIPF